MENGPTRQNIIDSIHNETEELRPLLDAHFKKRRDVRLRTRIDPRESSEFIHFGHVTLQVNEDPLIAIVVRTKKGLVPLVGPRLELHLKHGGGVHDTRRQLGRVARYTEARGLHETHPVITTSTYPKLSDLVQRIIPNMAMATVTYVSPENEGGEITDGIFESLEEFDGNNHHSHPVRTIDSLYVPTGQFVEVWRDQE